MRLRSSFILSFLSIFAGIADTSGDGAPMQQMVDPQMLGAQQQAQTFQMPPPQQQLMPPTQEQMQPPLQPIQPIQSPGPLPPPPQLQMQPSTQQTQTVNPQMLGAQIQQPQGPPPPPPQQIQEMNMQPPPPPQVDPQQQKLPRNQIFGIVKDAAKDALRYKAYEKLVGKSPYNDDAYGSGYGRRYGGINYANQYSNPNAYENPYANNYSSPAAYPSFYSSPAAYSSPYASPLWSNAYPSTYSSPSVYGGAYGHQKPSDQGYPMTLPPMKRHCVPCNRLQPKHHHHHRNYDSGYNEYNYYEPQHLPYDSTGFSL